MIQKIQRWTLEQVLVAWLYLNLSVERVEYVRQTVKRWGIPRNCGGYRGWIDAAQIFAAYRLNRRPPRRGMILWVLDLLLVFTGTIAFRQSIMPHWLAPTIMVCVYVVFANAGYNHRKLCAKGIGPLDS